MMVADDGRFHADALGCAAVFVVALAPLRLVLRQVADDQEKFTLVIGSAGRDVHHAEEVAPKCFYVQKMRIFLDFVSICHRKTQNLSHFM